MDAKVRTDSPVTAADLDGLVRDDVRNGIFEVHRDLYRDEALFQNRVAAPFRRLQE